MNVALTFKIPIHAEYDRICVRDSDIEGLFLEVDTLQELERELHSVVPYLLQSNHKISPEDLGHVTLVVSLAPDNDSSPIEKNTSPAVLWENVSSFRELAVA